MENGNTVEEEKNRTGIEIWKSLSKERKVKYFCDYYLLKTLAAAALICMAVFLCVQFVTKKDMVMGILAVNADGENPAASGPEYFDDFLADNGVNIKKNTVNLNRTMYIQAESDEAIDQTNMQTINTLFYTRSVDVFMADESFFDVMAKGDYLVDLRDYISEDVLNAQKDNIVYVYDGELGKKIAAGVRIDTANNTWMQQTGWYEMPEVIVGLADGMKSPELSGKMIEDILYYN